MRERGLRKVEVGVVVSDKMHKTISVRVERIIQHPRYKKFLRRHVTFKAHDEKGEAKTGDVVEIMETRPLSKTKNWRLVRVVARSRGGVASPAAAAVAESSSPSSAS
jgi:small subunit ribosomal protein S17